MYVEFFGLKHPPFRARASSRDVFVGPQQAKLMSGLKKALTERDAVVSLSGPVGVGKTVSASRALDAVTTQKSVARIGRMQLGREEILELLLIEFDLAESTHSTPQRFGAFRRLLNEKEDENVRVFIVVEDACRIGLDGLAELESLTSADSGDSSGANIILLGPPDFEELIRTPQLARLRQRIRMRHVLNAYTPAEVRGYIAHRIREAGGDFEAIFEGDAINAVHVCSEGIPRVVNSLCNAALTAAAETNTRSVSAALLRRIAREEFGFDDAPLDATPAAAAAPATKPAAVAPPSARPKPAPTPEAATGAAAPDALELPDDLEIPEFIQDTLPKIKALPDPDASKTPAEVLAALKDKTNSTEPSLPVLDMSLTRPPTEPELLDGLDAAALAAEERRIMLEPRAPEPLSKTLDPADTQTIKALDSALRPDTQLLEALDMVMPALGDNAPVPLGLQDPLAQLPANSNDAPQGSGTEKLPTLSESMRLESPPSPTTNAPKTPDINALEAALAVARKGPIDLGESTSTAPGRDAKAAAPEITLEDDMRRQQDAARARLAAEAAKVAASQVKKEKPQSQAERAAAAELAAEKERLSGMKSIAAQFSVGSELSLEDTHNATQRVTPPAKAAVQTPVPAAPRATAPAAPESAPKDAAEQEKMQKLAADLGSARSIEDIDDLAAETLFGEEFSQIAATIAAMAANDKDAEAEADDSDNKPQQSVAPVAAGAAPPATATNAPAARAAPPSAPVGATPARPVAQSAAPPPTPKRPPPADIDSSAARRLEMVRSLNKSRKPIPNAMLTEEIVLGSSDSSPTHSGPAPEPIENQFGTSMTANLKALSSQSIEAMQKAEKQQEEKKGGLLSRFKRP